MDVQAILISGVITIVFVLLALIIYDTWVKEAIATATTPAATTESGGA